MDREEALDLQSYVPMHLGVIFGSLTLITGSIWAHISWGMWWYWGSRELTTFLIIFLFYCAYFMLRFSVEPGEKRARYSAVYALLGVGLIPISVLAVRIAQDVIHPITSSIERREHGRQHVLHLPRLAGRDARAWRSRCTSSRCAASGSTSGCAQLRRLARGRRMIDETAVQYVAAVYGVTWVVAIAYIGILHTKLGRLERQLDEIVGCWSRGGSDG